MRLTHKIMAIIVMTWVTSGCYGDEAKDPFERLPDGDRWWWIISPEDLSTNNKPLEKITLCVGQGYVYPKRAYDEREDPQKYITRLQARGLVTVTSNHSDQPIEYTMKAKRSPLSCPRIGNIGIDLHFTAPLSKGEYTVSARFADGSDHRNLFTFGVSDDQPPKLLSMYIHRDEDDPRMSFNFRFSEPVYFPVDALASGPNAVFEHKTKRDYSKPWKYFGVVCDACSEQLRISTESITSPVSDESLAHPAILDAGVRASPGEIEITFDELHNFILEFDSSYL